jgi:hypothetical protein
MKVLALMIVIASTPALADKPEARLGATLGLQRTDRSAWVFGPALEIAITKQLSIRGEALLELGDIDDPFGPSNIRDGSGPHVNHVMFGPTWRPERFTRYALAAGAQAGVLVMHSTFAAQHFHKKPAIGVFVQAGHTLGPVAIALQFRVDASAGIDMAGPNGEDVPTTSARFNLAFEVPLDLR